MNVSNCRSSYFGLFGFVIGVAVGALATKYCKCCKVCVSKQCKGCCKGNKHANTKSCLESGIIPTANPNEFAKYIDHTILKPTCVEADIVKVCNEAVQHKFASVCVPPYWAPLAKQLVCGSGVKVAVVIGFPFGYSCVEAKVAEAIQAAAHGVEEIDIVANICAIKSQEWHYLEKEIRQIQCAIPREMIVKVIIESGVLTDEEIIKCCEIYGSAAIQYLKTSTGYAEKGASVHAVSLFRSNLPANVQIKASGGIRTRADAAAMIAAGATRLGCSASVAIVSEEEKRDTGSEAKGY